jgi:hypothetical protein
MNWVISIVGSPSNGTATDSGLYTINGLNYNL